jgi:hypothetical protein
VRIDVVSAGVEVEGNGWDEALLLRAGIYSLLLLTTFVLVDLHAFVKIKDAS